MAGPPDAGVHDGLHPTALCTGRTAIRQHYVATCDLGVAGRACATVSRRPSTIVALSTMRSRKPCWITPRLGMRGGCGSIMSPGPRAWAVNAEGRASSILRTVSLGEDGPA